MMTMLPPQPFFYLYPPQKKKLKNFKKSLHAELSRLLFCVQWMLQSLHKVNVQWMLQSLHKVNVQWMLQSLHKVNVQWMLQSLHKVNVQWMLQSLHKVNVQWMSQLLHKVTVQWMSQLLDRAEECALNSFSPGCMLLYTHLFPTLVHQKNRTP